MQWPPTPDPGLVNVGIGLRVRRTDDLEHVDPALGGEPRQLVGIGDVHVAVRRLGELGHLGCLGVGDGPDLGALVQHGPIEVGRPRGGLVARPADDLGVALEVQEDAAYQDSLRAEGQTELLEAEAAALRQHRSESVAGGADGEGRLVDDQRPGLQAGGDVARGAVDGPEVDLALRVDHHRDDDDHRLRLPHRVGGGGGCAQVARGDELRDALEERRLVVVRALPAIDGVDDARVDVRPDDGVAPAGVLHRQRQADVPEPDDGDLHASASCNALPAMTAPVRPASTILRASSSATIPSCGLTGGGPPLRTAAANSPSSTTSGSCLRT